MLKGCFVDITICFKWMADSFDFLIKNIVLQKKDISDVWVLAHGGRVAVEDGYVEEICDADIQVEIHVRTEVFVHSVCLSVFSSLFCSCYQIYRL